MIRCRAQRCPRRVRLGGWVAIGVGLANCRDWTPKQVVVLGVEAGDHPVAPGYMRHGQHSRRMHKVEPLRRDEIEHAIVPLPDVVVNPE